MLETLLNPMNLILYQRNQIDSIIYLSVVITWVDLSGHHLIWTNRSNCYIVLSHLLYCTQFKIYFLIPQWGQLLRKKVENKIMKWSNACDIMPRMIEKGGWRLSYPVAVLTQWTRDMVHCDTQSIKHRGQFSSALGK